MWWWVGLQGRHYHQSRWVVGHQAEIIQSSRRIVSSWHFLESNPHRRRRIPIFQRFDFHAPSRQLSSSLLPWILKPSCGTVLSVNHGRERYEHGRVVLKFSTRQVPHQRLSPNSKNKDSTAKRITWNISTLGTNQDWNGILELVQREGHHFNAINYAAAMNQLGRIPSFNKSDDARLEMLLCQVADHMRDKPSSWTLRTKVQVLHAIAKMRLPIQSENVKTVLSLILKESKSGKDPVSNFEIAHGNSQEISNTAWACAILEIPYPPMLEAINKRAMYLVTEGSPQTIANTAWACATLGATCTPFFEAIDANVSKVVDHGTVQAISNTVWAFATLGIKCPRLGNAIHDQASFIVTEGLPQNIANTAWGLATLGVSCPALFQAINDNASKIIQTGRPQAISNTAWAFATMGMDGREFLHEIDENATQLVWKGKPQEVANTIWAFATLDLPCPNLCAMIDQRASYLARTGTSQNLTNMLWSFATLGVECPRLCQAIEEQASRLYDKATSQTLANTLWAFAILGWDCPNFVQTIHYRVDYLVKTANYQEITNLCYSMAILDYVSGIHEPYFRRLWDGAMKIDWKCLEKQGRMQLLQALVMASNQIPVEIPQEWFDASEPWQVDILESTAQKEMSELLIELDIGHIVSEASPFQLDENPIMPGLLAIDAAACSNKEDRIAFEFDGPTHFLRRIGSWRMPEIENGPTKAKRRFLEALGWTVVNIPYYEWAEAETKDTKKVLILEKLQAAKHQRL